MGLKLGVSNLTLILITMQLFFLGGGGRNDIGVDVGII